MRGVGREASRAAISERRFAAATAGSIGTGREGWRREERRRVRKVRRRRGGVMGRGKAEIFEERWMWGWGRVSKQCSDTARPLRKYSDDTDEVS